jgi:hypothetical protein
MGVINSKSKNKPIKENIINSKSKINPIKQNVINSKSQIESIILIKIIEPIKENVINSKSQIESIILINQPLNIFDCRGFFADFKKIKYYVSNGADLNVIDNEGFNILSYMFSSGAIDVIEYLINDCNMDINYINLKTGDSFLHLIIRRYHQYNSKLAFSIEIPRNDTNDIVMINLINICFKYKINIDHKNNAKLNPIQLAYHLNIDPHIITYIESNVYNKYIDNNNKIASNKYQLLNDLDLTLIKENNIIKEICTICYDTNSDILSNCHHSYCQNCYILIRQKYKCCSYCRTTFSNTVFIN